MAEAARMSDYAARPLDGALVAGAHGAAFQGAPPVTVSEVTGQAIVQVTASAKAVDKVGKALAKAMGVNSAPEVGRADVGSKGVVLGIGPGRWMAVRDDHEGAALEAELGGAVPGGYATDLSHGRTVLRVSGARARDVLAKGTAVDLHPRTFAAGACAATAVADIAVLIHLREAAEGGAVFDVQVARGYARHFWEWLCNAAAEYGYAVGGDA